MCGSCCICQKSVNRCLNFLRLREKVVKQTKKWRNTKLTIFKDLFRQAKHKNSTLVHTDKCQFYTEGIALASSIEELHQIVNTLSNRHPKILPTIYPSADLPILLIRYLTNKEEKLIANITSEPATAKLVTRITTAMFSHIKCYRSR